MATKKNLIQFSAPQEVLDQLEALRQDGESIGLCAKRILLNALGQGDNQRDPSNEDDQVEKRLKKIESSLTKKINQLEQRVNQLESQNSGYTHKPILDDQVKGDSEVSEPIKPIDQLPAVDDSVQNPPPEKIDHPLEVDQEVDQRENTDAKRDEETDQPDHLKTKKSSEAYQRRIRPFSPIRPLSRRR